MKILHLIQRPQLRGAEIFASQIGEIHHRQGHEVLFVALFKNTAKQQLQLVGPGLKSLDLNERKRMLDLAGWQQLAKTIDAFAPDIVQANAADTLKYAVMSRKLFGWRGKLVFRNANKTSDFIHSTPKRLYNQWLAHQVDFVASVSRNCELDFQQIFRFPASKTATLTIGTPIPKESSLLDRKAVRVRLGLPQDEPLMVNIGSLVPEKNQVGLIDIFAAIYQEIGQGYLLLIGDGKTRSAVEARIAHHALGDRVRLLGFRADAVDILSACDLMIMPSFIEGMPGVILEAMARKVPVIASEVGGINEIIAHQRSGILGNPKENNSFIEPAIVLLRNTKQAQMLSEAAYNFCRKTKAIEVIADQFMDAYKKLLYA